MPNLSKFQMQMVMCQAFSLDDTFSIDALEKKYRFDNTLKEETKSFSDIHEFYSVLREKGILGRDPIWGDKDYCVDYSDLDEIKKKIEELINENNKALNSVKEDGNITIPLSKIDTLKRDVSSEPISDKIIQQFRKISPTKEMTSFYSITFLKTVLKYMIENDEPFSSLAISTELTSSSTLFSLLQRLVFCIWEDEILDKFNLIIYEVNEAICDIISSNDFTTDKLEELKFYAQIILCIISIEDLEKKNDSIKNSINLYEDEVFTYINYFISKSFHDKSVDDYSIGIAFAKQSLNISNYIMRQRAFYNLGDLAYQAGGQLQLAYDVFYSWIYRKVVGEVKPLYIKEPAFDEKEEEWREKEGLFEQAIMRAHFAAVCVSIGNTYETTTTKSRNRQQIFYKIAKDIMAEAVDLLPEDHYLHSLYGEILSIQNIDNLDYSLILEQYKIAIQCAKKVNNINGIIHSMNRYYNIVGYLLTDEYVMMVNKKRKEKNEFSFALWKESNTIKTYRDILWKAPDEYNRVLSAVDEKTVLEKERKVKDAIISSITFGKNCPQRTVINDIALLLVLIRKTAREVQNQLRRLEYSNLNYKTRLPDKDRKIDEKRSDVKTIAYYTTLKNATYLFDELIQKESDIAPEKDEKVSNGKNCLTVVHAKYMNDPYEGLPLLDSLTAGLRDNKLFPDGSSMQFREDIYNESFVFLKSFTEKVDKLFMWNRYASDYDADGKNSNGCCIQFDPEMFNQMISYPSGQNALTLNDDYYLYRMVYISNDGNINKELNPGITDETINLYNALKRLLFELNEQLNVLSISVTFDMIIDKVRTSLRDALRTIVFLFKSDDYAEEVESRLIFERDFKQQKSIRFVSKEPYKLAINPYKQIYINKIIFGPNVRNAEEWIPYFQFELNKLWAKYSEITGDTSCPVHKRYSIEKSSIHYHT